MAELTFHTNPLSRGRIARWMLEETAIPYHTVIVPFGAEMKAPAYAALNPMGKVPTICHNGQIVTEAAAICAYLADAFPEAGLAPPPEERASYYRWLFFAAGPLEAAVTNRALGVDVEEEHRRMVGYGCYDDVMDTLEKAVSATPYIAGDSFTAADVYICSHIAWGIQSGGIETRTAFGNYLQRIGERPAYLRAAELDNASAQALKASA